MTHPFAKQPLKRHYKITLIEADRWKKNQKNLTTPQKAQTTLSGFEAKPGSVQSIYDDPKDIDHFLAGYDPKSAMDDGAAIADKISKLLSKDTLEKASFEFAAEDLAPDILQKLCLGWGLHGYVFDKYKDKNHSAPTLLCSKNIDQKFITAQLDAITSLRDLINTPANELGPVELQDAAEAVAKSSKAKVTSIIDEKLLDKNFPVIHLVGQAADKTRRPRLIDMKWGKKTHPKVTIVGKGVVFDTGGLDLKPSQYMRYMKKDMGGAAHALALAQLIMEMNLPIQLRLLIPAVENAVSGNAFRPGDVVKSRKGITIENTNTDAEGRLILADSLTYACEDNPDLIIDFATLTGSARAALGPDIPAMFSTNKEYGQKLEDISFKVNDPLWNMPLHDAYRKQIESNVADLQNSAGTPGDLIYSALFLKEFLIEDKGKLPNWIHIDCFAWENSGKPGRPKDGADTGLRATFAFLQDLFG